jgi:spore maturation protein CgeB
LKNLKVALISDSLTESCLQFECNVRIVSPLNYMWVLYTWKPDILFVESTWEGKSKNWKFKVASYPDYPKRNNKKLKKVVDFAKDLNIPTVFWNKEDDVHCERFINSAKLFDHVFTVDKNCLSEYKKRLDPTTTLNTMLFPIQPATHYPTDFSFKHKKACFVGSYSTNIHDKRRYWQDLMFESSKPLGLTVFDRNSERKSAMYRYPELEHLEVKAAVSHVETANIYRDYMVSLNVNTIENSPTMFSRRLVEILACGSLAVTNPSLSVDKLFGDYCHVISNINEAKELLLRLSLDGLSQQDKDMVKAGSEFVMDHHTWKHRLEMMSDIVKF